MKYIKVLSLIIFMFKLIYASQLDCEFIKNNNINLTNFIDNKNDVQRNILINEIIKIYYKKVLTQGNFANATNNYIFSACKHEGDIINENFKKTISKIKLKISSNFKICFSKEIDNINEKAPIDSIFKKLIRAKYAFYFKNIEDKQFNDLKTYNCTKLKEIIYNPTLMFKFNDDI